MSIDYTACSDGELAALTLAGRQSAFAEIMGRHRKPIYRLVRGLVGDSEEALDLTQDCFVSAYTHLRTYDGARPMRAWLSRIAINKCRDWRRRRAVRKLFTTNGVFSVEEVNAVPDDGPSAYEMLAGKSELDRLMVAINQLPASLREVLLLRTMQGLNQADTAAALSISGKAVETRLHRARARLVEFLAERRGESHISA